MTKELNFNRNNKEYYIRKFEESNKSITWPPKEGVVPTIKDKAIDLIEEEIKGLLMPQLQELGTTINSAGIIKILIDNSNKLDICYNTPKEFYENLSKVVFTEIEQESSKLLGQEDTCGWFNQPT